MLTVLFRLFFRQAVPEDTAKKLTLLFLALDNAFVLVVLALPLLLFVPLLSVLNPSGDVLQTDPYYLAIQELREEYEIENDLSPYIAKSIWFVLHQEVSSSQQEASQFIEDNFIKETEIEVTVEEEVYVNGKLETVEYTTTKTIYYFYTLTELIPLLQQEPFLFTDEDIYLIQNLYFEQTETDTDITLRGKYPMPADGWISSGYGNRVDPLNGKYFMHPALDIVPEHHAPVRSIADGTVVKVDTTPGGTYGNNITIRHEQDGDVFYTFSAHLSKILVEEGQQLSQGDVIGLEGGDPQTDPNPGRTTGHHLHFEIWTGPTRESHTNPADYLQMPGTESQTKAAKSRLEVIPQKSV